MTTELKDKLTEIQEKLNELVQQYGYDDTKLAFNNLKIPNETTQKSILEAIENRQKGKLKGYTDMNQMIADIQAWEE